MPCAPWRRSAGRRFTSVSTECLAHRRRDDNGTRLVARPSKGARGQFPPARARWHPCGPGTVPSEAGMSPTNPSKSPGGSVLSICRGRLSCITLKPSRPEQLNRSVSFGLGSFDLGRPHGNYPDPFCLFMRFLQGQLSAGFSGVGCYLVDSSRSRASGSSVSRPTMASTHPNAPSPPPACAVFAHALGSLARPAAHLDRPETLSSLQFRQIGPAVTGGSIHDVEARRLVHD